jgi:hypothetical protein
MILSYRILRDLKLEYPDKIIMLHSSENPIGPMRLWGGINNLTTSAHRWHEPGLIQSDLYAPFIDRYADYLLRGEGYPIDIQLLSNKIANYVSKHIKYVVCPKGKSNSSGILIWTDTGAPFAAKNASYKFSYYSENFPISLGLSRSHYTYFKNPENNPDDRKINRLMVMNAIYDNYLKSGNLIMRTAAEEHLPAEFDRRIHKCDQGPGETTSTGYQMVFGPFNDYYRPVSIVWNTNLLTLTESR